VAVHYIMNSRKAAFLILGCILITTFIISAEPVLRTLGDDQETVNCDQSMQSTPPSTIENGRALYKNCSCFSENNDPAKARECYMKVESCADNVFDKDPSNPGALGLKTDAEDKINELQGDLYKRPPGSNCTCIKNSSYDSILAGYDKVIRLDPKNAKAWNNRGVLLGELCCTKDAKDSFDEAIRINSSLAEPWYNKGVSIFYEDPQEALEDFNRSVKLDHGFAEAWFNRYPLLMPSNIDMSYPAYSRAYREAMDSYNKSLEEKPDLGVYIPPYLIYKRIE
jgi:tetratricopeptide (TPR) repeat protein